ncbi:prephenate dehydrogenase [Clostridium homopropionicum DSM 5847]|uniref:Prephenate dehydrogenase n=1 Tax=Clostridium homopropionicum DSM 5847 TaxID=1121318 RepID=A0A0L6Z7V6_9CLOT|nr:prephenate dehydrogenase [Clostridium homopropionicum]KOA18878.1 prephenate dehydrogenase [Clostridium homopropionicum DSM 5847]SFG45863.1 prephenate dehydrogenase [Clostridium homopropionicum]
MEDTDFKITIIGLGLIGGSYALALKELKPSKIYGVDISEESLRLGEAMEVIDKGYTDPKEPLMESDLVIMCVYPKLVKEFIKDNMDYFKMNAVITDVTGIKSQFVEEVNGLLREDIDFVFAHPMAGREFSGLKYASKEIFKGANFIITPTDRNKEQNIKLIENMAIKMGFKNIEKVKPEIHDKIIGFTSQLPHVIAVSLVNSDNSGLDTGKFTGDSYRDLTRIARINTKLWSELFLGNKENLINEINEFQQNIAELKNAIENEDIETLNKILSRASKKREEMS